MEPTKRLDQFAEIAFREHPGNKDELRDIPPITVDKKYFAPGTDKAKRVPELTFEAQMERFHEELDQLREKYRPYMRNVVPAPSMTRDRQVCSQFQFRYQTPEDVSFTRVLDGAGDWEAVTIPDFRGPSGEEGKWTGFYRSEFAYPGIPVGKRVYLVFKGVDYKTTVYLNHKCIGSHEGFFAPFEFDVTDFLQENNTLVVEVQTDIPMMGVGGTKLDGDKIYAATGPGWDDPYNGWSHCPPGAGIYNKVYLEQRSELFIQDVFVRPDIDTGSVEVWIDAVNTTTRVMENFELELAIMPQNFEGEGIEPISFTVAYAGPGINYFRYKVEFPAFKMWEPESPLLYAVRIEVKNDRDCVDSRDRTFGMRKFHMDEQQVPKGTLYLNNQPIVLRGANEMGHLQQCVMNNDFDQLMDDILIAKLANLNFYRITQRPVQEEIYDYFDMLGMMHQCDLPTFGFIRRNQFVEGVKQAAEMERLIRSHPSSIMVSLINEPSRTEKRRKGHRYLHRNELEAFFVASRQAIFVENPDRVVKNVEGDYNPPTREGLPDFHCYNLWYTNNVIPVGKMYKGYLPTIREGWKAGCGEYGTEGLDHAELMLSRYPKEWLPTLEQDRWLPNSIHGAQTYNLHGDWYAEQTNMHDWIQASQKHQSLATKLMTDAWRRRADRVVSTAIHLLIDAWPAGWMKALVGVDRKPKPAYFTYKDCLEPVRVNLRSDRWKVYESETLEIEAWLLNDTAKEYGKCRIVATLRDDSRDYAHYEIASLLPIASSQYAGSIRFSVPSVQERQQLYVDAELIDEDGHVLNTERFTFEAFAKMRSQTPQKVAYLDAASELLGSLLNVSGERYSEEVHDDCTLVVSSPESFNSQRTAILAKVRKGATAVCILKHADNGTWDLDDTQIQTVKLREVYTLSMQVDGLKMANVKPDDYSYFYNLTTDRLDGMTNSHLIGEGIEPIVFAYQAHSETPGKRKLPVVGLKRLGKGLLFFVCLPLAGRVGFNPTLDRLLVTLMSEKGVSPECCTPLLATIRSDEPR
ncbi:glycosyl hydrolase 2 galactose-binding domain-containing protein [Paenibacillus sp. MAH-36]|uniref:Glycoside hydrolase family 2 TIM barrel-domain containing protein n=1 Tax=Paenibacillus violae TaxID=3077234 RepID=A0ABU3R5K3_9BACL|nr:glycoside hydrolase family 2 TIM barrel-domain containing protein [Paenibacillus sp. PFR10]MDU0199551.1 glycoside hydrolase family 2 TIM barrel-domain containing protein [Paenibacillus sp. PFR10]